MSRLWTKLCATDLPAPKLVKLDVEGAAVRALTGMLQTLRHHKPAIVCEIHGSLDEVCKLLEAENYTVSRLARDDDGDEYGHVLSRPR